MGRKGKAQELMKSLIGLLYFFNTNRVNGVVVMEYCKVWGDCGSHRLLKFNKLVCLDHATVSYGD
jgi:hypothetical protein